MSYIKSLLTITFSLFCLQLAAQEPDSIPAAVLEFYGTDEVPKAGNDRAPEETKQFGQLVGVWYCQGFMPDPQGKVDQIPYKAFWAWKYILDGYGVQDFFYEGKREFPYWDYFKRDRILTQLRVFDKAENNWKIAYITNNGGEIPGQIFGTFTAKQEGDELIMEFPPKDSTKMSRIIFSEITADTFKWRSESSKDSGVSWKVVSELAGKRLK